MLVELSYPTHYLKIEQENNSIYTKVTNHVLNSVYQDMVMSIIGMDENRCFVYEERILLNNFLKSLVGCHNNKYENTQSAQYTFITFDDETAYYVFCIVNDLKFKEQVWFKTALIQNNLINSTAFLVNASYSLIGMVYPSLVQLYRKYEGDITDAQKYDTIIKSVHREFKCSPSLHSDFLEKNEIKYLYHFTNYRNVESIKKNGLCSYQELKNKNITPKLTSTEESKLVDESKGLGDYVHLSYERKNPMLYVALAEGRLQEYKIYEISTDVIFWKDTMYSDCNAAKNGAIISKDIKFFLNFPFEKFHKKQYFYLNSESKELFKSEVLVKNIIPSKFILNLNID